MNNFNRFIIFVLFLMTISNVTIMAAGPLATPKAVTDPSGLVTKVDSIAKVLYGMLFAIAVIFLLMAAFSYLTSGGDVAKVKKASGQLVYAVVAIIVGMLAFSIAKLIENKIK